MKCTIIHLFTQTKKQYCIKICSLVLYTKLLFPSLFNTGFVTDVWFLFLGCYVHWLWLGRYTLLRFMMSVHDFVLNLFVTCNLCITVLALGTALYIIWPQAYALHQKIHMNATFLVSTLNRMRPEHVCFVKTAFKPFKNLAFLQSRKRHEKAVSPA